MGDEICIEGFVFFNFPDSQWESISPASRLHLLTTCCAGLGLASRSVSSLECALFGCFSVSRAAPCFGTSGSRRSALASLLTSGADFPEVHEAQAGKTTKKK